RVANAGRVGDQGVDRRLGDVGANVVLDHGGEVLLLQVRQQRQQPAGPVVRLLIGSERVQLPRREHLIRAVVVVQGQADLAQVVGALHPGGCLGDFLPRRQQQADENRNNGDDDQQLDQRERRPSGGNHSSILQE